MLALCGIMVGYFRTLIPTPHIPHRAIYDAHGNIIILPDDDRQCAEHRATLSADLLNAEPQQSPEPSHEALPQVWTVVEERASSLADDTADRAGWLINEPDSHVIEQRQHPAQIIRRAVMEGHAQLQATVEGTRETSQTILETMRRIPSQGRRLLVRFAAIAHHPIRIGSDRKRTKPRSRATLFALDSLRFGGTFAAIFIVLFSAINYQSFWQIAKADLALQDDSQLQQELGSISTQRGVTTDTAAPGTSMSTSNVLTYLPGIGPPDNRLIIPKLGKNVPIIAPPMDALINADWKKLEEEIQSSLLNGVVYYPGTAKPGQPGNFFLTGHSSYYPFVKSDYKDVFALLGRLDVGDTYSVYYGGDLHQFSVIEKKEVNPSDVSVLDQPSDKRLSTLMTCTPVGTTLRRLIIVAQEVDPVTGVTLKVGEHGHDDYAPARPELLPI